MTDVMFPRLNVEKIQNMSLADLNEMGCLVVQNITDVEKSIEFLNHEWSEERKSGLDENKLSTFEDMLYLHNGWALVSFSLIKWFSFIVIYFQF